MPAVITTVAIYTCKVYGDGLSPETAFRPAISDVRDLAGKVAFQHNFCISVGVDGKPLSTTCDVQALGDPTLIALNPDVTLKVVVAP